MTIVKSPYNFVPAPNENAVHKPDWANQVSHDIPFSDGESGELTLQITAETPLFIRNGHSKDQVENEFSHVMLNGEKKYFIPGSSLKGMFRNVLEIMSYSKLNSGLVNDDRYAFRDLTNGSLYLNTYKSSDVKGGWLRENEKGDWVIEECERLALIHHEDVDAVLGTSFRNDYFNRNPTEKTAKAKYIRCGARPLTHRFDSVVNKNNKLIARPNINGELGTIVFTGQSSKRNESKDRPSGKVHEFVFFSSESPSKIDVTGKMQKDFRFIYHEDDNQNISPDWDYWKAELKQGQKIPVFYTKDGAAEIKHFGLAYMYKLPFENSIHQMEPLINYGKQRDLAEIMFGYTEKDESLKGRITLSHAFSNNAVPLGERFEILASPKASYFPFYVQQFKNGTKDYNTYQDTASLRGFKRYPGQASAHSRAYTPEQSKNSNVFSCFNPIDKGAIFLCKVRFHNLRKSEIGALISAITFHDNEHRCYHSLGGAKPYGYGKVKVEIEALRYLSETKENYLASFEEVMGGNWVKSESLSSLLAMASSNQNMEYPSIEGVNEFNEYKKEKLTLEPVFDSQSIESLLKRKEIEEKRVFEELRRKEALERIEAETAAYELAVNSSDLDVVLDFIRKYPVSEFISLVRNREVTLRIKIKKEAANELANQSIHFENYDFSLIKSLLNPYLKNKQFVFSAEQKESIYQALTESHKLEATNRKSEWNKGKYGQYPWSDIVKWLGDDMTKLLFNQLTQ